MQANDMAKHRGQAAQAACLPAPPRRIKSDTSYETAHLQRHIDAALQQLQEACARLQRHEAELQAFLGEYQQQTGPYVQELRQLYRRLAGQRGGALSRAGQEHIDEAADTALQTLLPLLPQGRLPAPDWRLQLQPVYARMKDMCMHRHTGRYSAHIARLIDEAYARCSPAALHSIEHKLAALLPGAKEAELPRLRQRYDDIVASVQGVQAHLAALEVSPAWKLKSQWEANRYVLDNVVHHIRQHIAELTNGLQHYRTAA